MDRATLADARTERTGFTQLYKIKEASGFNIFADELRQPGFIKASRRA
jgi:hypothetical protein